MPPWTGRPCNLAKSPLEGKIDMAVILSPEEVGKYHPYDIDNYYLPGSNLKEWVIPSLEEGKSLSVPFLFIKGVNGGLAP